MQRQLGMFMVILITVSTVIIALLIHTLTMDKLRSIATLKLVGASDRTIIGLIVQEALMIGVTGFWLGVAFTAAMASHFPRRVLILPRDVGLLFGVVLVVCLLASVLAVRAAVKVEPSQARAG
ncbi:MAG: FtsX-like permease family protein [Betaproteobacteria bacterium]|nr:FtsX-like permease family protein [Betaproteobacteria bacterium]